MLTSARHTHILIHTHRHARTQARTHTHAHLHTCTHTHPQTIKIAQNKITSQFCAVKDSKKERRLPPFFVFIIYIYFLVPFHTKSWGGQQEQVGPFITQSNHVGHSVIWKSATSASNLGRGTERSTAISTCDRGAGQSRGILHSALNSNQMLPR